MKFFKKNVLQNFYNNKRRSLAIASLLLIAVFAPAVWYLTRNPEGAKAAQMELSTTASTIQIDVANRYRAIIEKDSDANLIRFYDRAENDSSPDLVLDYKDGGRITEEGNDYLLRRDANRKTTILEVTNSRIIVRIEGCLYDNTTTNTCLTDGTNGLTRVENIVFTPNGVFFQSVLDFKDGVVLDTSGSTDRYHEMKLDFDDGDLNIYSTSILVGDGETESTKSTSETFTTSDKYFVVQATGNYQDIFFGLSQNGDVSPETDSLEWRFNAQDSPPTDTNFDFQRRQPGTAGTVTVDGIRTTQWFLHFKPQVDLDTEVEREALANSIRNPDYPDITTGSTFYDGAGATSGQAPLGAGSALKFDNDNDYVTITDTANNSPSEEITVSAWIYMNTLPTTLADDNVVVSKYDTERAYLLRVEEDADKLEFRIDDDGASGNTSYVLSNSALTTQRWYHVVGVFNSNDAIALYIDGAYIRSDYDDSSTSIFDSSDPVVIGAESAGSSNTMDGIIDDVRIFDKALSQEEVLRIMKGERQVATANLIGHWTFDENTGSTAHDESSNNEDGTITGAVWTTGYVPTQYNPAEGAYTFNLASGNQGVFDLDGGSNFSSTLSAAATAGDASFTMATATSPSQGVAFINGDKFSYTTSTTTTMDGIPTSGDLALIGHASGDVISHFSRINPFFKLRGWRELTAPLSINVENVQKNLTADYNASVKPVTNAVFAQDLTWYSTFEDSSSATSPDVGSAGTVNNATFTSGKYGNAMLSDSGSEYISVPMSNNLNATTGTIEFWYKETDSPANFSAFFESEAANDDFTLEKASDTGIAMDIANTADTTWSPIPIVFDGEWHHIRFTYDTTNDSYYLYIDGASQGEKTTTYPDVTIGSNNIAVGTNYFGQSIEGMIDEFRIYDTVLGPDPIAQGGDTSDSAEYLADDTNDYTFDFTAVDANNRGEYLYFGSESQFTGLNIDLATVGAGSSPVLAYDYWNGSTWTTLNLNHAVPATAQNLLSSGTIGWQAPGNWFPYSVNGSTDLYYIRAHLASGSYTTAPIENQITTDILTLQYLDTITSTDTTFEIPDLTSNDTAKGGEPVAMWLFDENYGTTTNNHQGSDHALTISGATWINTDDQFSSEHVYLSFDGTDDYATTGHHGDFEFATNPFTISAWFRHSSSISGTDILLANHTDAGYKIYMDSSGNICFAIADDSTWGNAESVCTYGNSYADSRWHHVSAVKSNTTTITLYTDGLQVGQVTLLTETGSLSTGGDLYIGIDTDGSSNPWDGFIDTVVIYPYARSADQVKNDYLHPLTGVEFGK